MILPISSPSAAMSRYTTGFFVDPEENSLPAAIANEQYFKRFFICNILASCKCYRASQTDLRATISLGWDLKQPVLKSIGRTRRALYKSSQNANLRTLRRNDVGHKLHAGLIGALIGHTVSVHVSGFFPHWAQTVIEWTHRSSKVYGGTIKQVFRVGESC